MPKKTARKARPGIAKVARLRMASVRVDVTREEYKQIIDRLQQGDEIINELRRELDVQFKRMAQMQSELDEVRHAWLKGRRGGDAQI